MRSCHSLYSCDPWYMKNSWSVGFGNHVTHRNFVAHANLVWYVNELRWVSDQKKLRECAWDVSKKSLRRRPLLQTKDFWFPEIFLLERFITRNPHQWYRFFVPISDMFLSSVSFSVTFRFLFFFWQWKWRSREIG